jgi:hypothetical protein
LQGGASFLGLKVRLSTIHKGTVDFFLGLHLVFTRRNGASGRLSDGGGTTVTIFHGTGNKGTTTASLNGEGNEDEQGEKGKLQNSFHQQRGKYKGKDRKIKRLGKREYYKFSLG